MKTFYFIIVFIFATGALAAPVASMSHPVGVDRELNVDDFFRHPKVGARFNELWFYAFVFDSGEKAYVGFSIMNPPVIGSKCGAELSIHNFRGRNYCVARGLPQSELRQNRADQTIRIGEKFHMKGLPGTGHHVSYETEKNEGFLLDVTFSSSIKGKVRGDGIFRSGETQYAQYIHIPYGRVSGTLRVGSHSKQVNGYGYMEHTWQNVLVSKLATHAIQVFGKGAMPVGRTIIGSKHYSNHPFGYSLDISSEEALVVFPKSVSGNSHPLTYQSPVPDRYSIDWLLPSIKSSFLIRADQEKYFALSTVDGLLKKKAAKVALGGELVFYRGNITTDQDVMAYNVMGVE